MNRSSEVDPTSVARLLWINLLNSNAFRRLQGRFALEIGREKQPREIKGPSRTKAVANDPKWMPRGLPVGAPWSSENEINITKGVVLHLYFWCPFQKASWATFFQKTRPNNKA